MINSINIMPRNNKGQNHGYWEVYWYNGKLMYKCLFHNDKEIGYEEYNSYLDKISKNRYYI